MTMRPKAQLKLRPFIATRRIGIVLLVLAAIFGATAAPGMSAPTASSGAEANCATTTKLKFQLDIAPDGRHAPWYVAQQKGYYAQACLDVQIVAGSGSGAVTTNTAAGTVQAGFLDVLGVLLAKDSNKATPLVYGATIYAHAPYAIFSYAQGDNITKPTDTSGKQIGCPATSKLCPLAQAWSQGKGYGTITFKDVPQANEFALFKAGQISSIVTYNLSRPVLEVPGKKLNMLLFSNYGLEPFYGNGIVFNSTWASEHVAAAKAFVAASLRGFQYAAEHPQGAIDIMTNLFPTIDANIAARQLEIESGLLASKSAATMGCIRDDAVAATVDFSVKGLGMPAADTKLPLVTHAYEPKTCQVALTSKLANSGIVSTKAGRFVSVRVNGTAKTAKVRITLYGLKHKKIRTVTRTVKTNRIVRAVKVPKTVRSIKVALVKP